MKRFIIFLLLNICLLLVTIDIRTSFAQNEVKQDTNYRIGNPNDVPGVEKIIYHWGRGKKIGTVDMSTKKPLSKREKDSLNQILTKRFRKKEKKIAERREYYLKMQDSINRIIVNDTINNDISNYLYDAVSTIIPNNYRLLHS